MQAAARGRGWPRSDPYNAQSTVARREPAQLSARVGGAFAPEIAFLAAQGWAPGALLQAEAAARRYGVSAEQALLGEGLIGEDGRYRTRSARLTPRGSTAPPLDRHVRPSAPRQPCGGT
jgi:hypothetical protein